MSAGSPNRWTGQIARVRGVMAASIRRGVDDVRVGLDVDEDRRRAGVQDRADGRVERVTDGDDLVAGDEAQALEDAHQGDGPVADRDGVLRADERRPALLELGRPAAAGEHAALEHLGDGGDLLGPDVRVARRGSCVGSLGDRVRTLLEGLVVEA